MEQRAAPLGGTPSSGITEPSPSRAERRQIQPTRGLRQMAERVGAGVAVVGRVREGADAAGVEHDDEGAPSDPSSHRAILARVYGRRICARGCDPKYTSRRRSADRCV